MFFGLSDGNWSRTHNHLVCKGTLNHSANDWVFVYELSGCGFESSCRHLNFRFRGCFEQGVPWHSGNYRMSVHSETPTWQDKNIQLIFFGVFTVQNLKIFYLAISFWVVLYFTVKDGIFSWKSSTKIFC